jgi:hypothetical protein
MRHLLSMFFQTWREQLPSNAWSMTGLQISIKLIWLGVQPMATQPTDLSKRVAGCKPLPSYCHNSVASQSTSFTTNIMRVISLNEQGDYVATVCGIEMPVMVDCHICTWVEAQAVEMSRDPNVNLNFDECRIWIYQNWIA